MIEIQNMLWQHYRLFQQSCNTWPTPTIEISIHNLYFFNLSRIIHEYGLVVLLFSKGLLSVTS
jgi:hypothetical protein